MDGFEPYHSTVGAELPSPCTYGVFPGLLGQRISVYVSAANAEEPSR